MLNLLHDVNEPHLRVAKRSEGDVPTVASFPGHEKCSFLQPGNEATVTDTIVSMLLHTTYIYDCAGRCGVVSFPDPPTKNGGLGDGPTRM